MENTSIVFWELDKKKKVAHDEQPSIKKTFLTFIEMRK